MAHVGRGVRALLIGSALALAACGAGDKAGETAEASAETPAAPQEVNVYSGRHYDADIAIYDEFTRETGVQVNLIEASGAALIERLAQEGEDSPADLFITADAGMLWRGEQRGLFQAMDDGEIFDRVPANLRHPEGMWVGVTSRARIIIFNKEMGLPDGVATYADLARPELEGSICIRPSSNIYNQSLLASIIAHGGEAAAEDWARGVAANFARKPQGNDTAQIEAVAAGLCRLGVVNSYYVARFIGAEDPEKAAIGEKIGVLFPNQETTGAHLNISGVGLAANAPHPDAAKSLVKFLLRDSVQARFAQSNNEYPVVEGVDAEGPVTLLGSFDADDINVSAFGENQPTAVEIFDRVDWP